MASVAEVLRTPELVSERGGYRSGNLLVFPLQGDGADALLAKAYLRLAAEGTLVSVFYERLWSLTEFLNWGLDKKNIFLAAFEGPPGDDANARFCGISWINRPIEMGGGKTKSEIGMAFFRNTPAMALGQLMLHWLFDHLELDVLFGTTPQQNRAALAYSRRIGFSLHKLPCFTTWQGQMTDAMVSMMTREMWHDRYAKAATARDWK